MFDREAQAARAGRAHHEPRATAREMFVGDFLAKLAVVDLVVVPADTLLRHSGGAASLENIEGDPLEFRRDQTSGCRSRSHSSWKCGNFTMSAKLLISARGSKFFFAQSSQNGQPVPAKSAR